MSIPSNNKTAPRPHDDLRTLRGIVKKFAIARGPLGAIHEGHCLVAYPLCPQWSIVMTNRKYGYLLVAILLLGMSGGHAVAAMTTYIFSGIVQFNLDKSMGLAGPTGQTINGVLSVDPAAIGTSFYSTNGSTFASGTTTYYPPYSIPPAVSGNANDGLYSFSVGNGTKVNEAYVEVYRNWGGIDYHFNKYLISGSSIDIGSGLTSSEIDLFAWDSMGVNTQIFSDMNPADLALDQPINWWSPNSLYGFLVWDHGRQESGLITSIEVVTASIPEPAAFGLLILAWVELTLLRKRRGRMLFPSRCKLLGSVGIAA